MVDLIINTLVDLINWLGKPQVYKRFPPIHSPDRAKDPKTSQVDGGDGAGGSQEDEEDVEDRPVASESPSDEADNEGRQ